MLIIRIICPNNSPCGNGVGCLLVLFSLRGRARGFSLGCGGSLRRLNYLNGTGINLIWHLLSCRILDSVQNLWTFEIILTPWPVFGPAKIIKILFSLHWYFNWNIYNNFNSNFNFNGCFIYGNLVLKWLYLNKIVNGILLKLV